MKLHVLVEQDESGFYTVEVPALPGCLSQGKTQEEALINIQEAIEGWVDKKASAKWLGCIPPKGFPCNDGKRRISIYPVRATA